MLVSAMCGSLRTGSYNQALLEAAIARAPEHGLEIVQVDISRFPLFSQDYEQTGFPDEVLAAKGSIAPSACVLLVTPEHNYGVPGVLKNAVDWLSRPRGDPTLNGRPMALMGASTGYMGTIRAQLAWRQMWHFFKAPVFSQAEMTVAFAAKATDADGRLVDGMYISVLSDYLEALHRWLEHLGPDPLPLS
jgi:chromate reductase, NAD(P)H dehydrogenase (quinone)